MTDPFHIEIVLKPKLKIEIVSSQEFIEDNAIVNALDPHFALVVIMVWMGIKPAVFFDVIEEPVNYIVRKVDPTYFDKQPLTYPPAAPVVPRIALLFGRFRASQCPLCVSSHRSASIAAMQPVPAAVTACRYVLSMTSPQANTPGTFV